jgi:hypothetical protein
MWLLLILLLALGAYALLPAAPSTLLQWDEYYKCGHGYKCMRPLESPARQLERLTCYQRGFGTACCHIRFGLSEN